MKCPECGKAAEIKGEPYLYQGKRFVRAACPACGYVWGAPVVATVDAPTPAPPPAPEAAPVPATRLIDRGAGFDPEKVRPGQVVTFIRAGQEKSGPVVSVTRKTVVVDVDGIPDFRVQKADLLGQVVQA
jgi:hypothetical protein